MALTADGSLSTCCKTLQHNLLAINAPNQFNALKHFGLLNALESDQNRAGIDPGVVAQLEALYGRGTINDGSSTCKFKLWVDKPICGTATDGVGTLCANSNTNGPTDNRIQIDVNIGEGRYVEGRIRPTDFQCLCAGTQAEVIQRELNIAAIKILTSVEADLVTAVNAAMGDYIDGTDSKLSPKTLNLFASTATRFEAQPVGWTPLMLQYAQMQTTGGVLAVGGDAAFGYSSALQLAPTLAPSGYALPQGINMWYDPNIQALADATFVNPLLTWAPGALWVMRYLDNVRIAENHIVDANVERVVLDIYGHLFDFSVHRDGSCDTLRWVLNYQWDLWNLPQTVFGTCLDTNQKQAYNIGCDIMDCADLS